MKIIGAKIEEPCSAEDVLQKVEDYKRKNGTTVQVFDPDMVIGRDHLKWAYEKAKECFENGTNRADSLEIEIILWSSGRRQIRRALDKMGLPDRAEKAAILVEDDPEEFLSYMGWERYDAVLEPSKEKLKNFGISEEEMASVDKKFDLVFERMAVSQL